jgi:hypothetical protein
MAFEVQAINSYSYSNDNSSSKDNLRLVSDNSAQKAGTPEKVIEQNVVSTNSALLFEYTQSIAKSNIAQQLVLDANLKETLKFLNSEAAKRMSQTPKKKFGSIVEHIFADNDVQDFETNEQTKEDLDLLELFDIKVDTSKENIFAA